MQNYTSVHVSIDYPDQCVWREDNNFVLCTNRYGAYPLRGQLTVTAGGNTYNYDYTTEVGSLTFRLSPLLRMLPTYTQVMAVVVTTVDDGGGNQHSDTVKFDFYYHYGKTLQERHHGSCRIITYADAADTSKVEVFKPEGWRGGVFFAGAVTTVNTTPSEILTLDPGAWARTSIQFRGSVGSAVYSGDVWDERYDSMWDIRLVQVCPRRNGIKFVYYDTDGCKRYAIGDVLTKKMTAKREEYRRGGEVYNDVPRSLLNGYDGTVEVGFSDVDPLQYLEDIMLSPVVTTTRGGKEIKVIPTTLTLTREGKTKDIVISFKLDA